jgi:hypothetical protein
LLSDYVNQFTSCNAGGHLDSLAINLDNNPTASGYIVIYGPGGLDGQYGKHAADVTKEYLLTTRGVEESRLRVIYGGLNTSMEELLTEVWLVPRGAEPPPVSKHKPDLKVVGKYAEFDTWDGTDEGEGWSNSEVVTMVGLSDLMRRRPDALAHLVVYHNDESAPGTWRRVAERLSERLLRNGVGAERVKVVFGGYAEETKAQLWILPPDAKPPVRARRERRPERSMQVASLDEFQLRYRGGERWAFKGLTDVLKADAQLTACLILRLPAAKEIVSRPDSPVDPDEPPDVDLVQLSEKWKDELKKNGIGEHRLIVIVVPPTQEWSSAGLETWVVPPGALLPDPSAEDESSVEEENPEEF